jgi:hypothetical protein
MFLSRGIKDFLFGVTTTLALAMAWFLLLMPTEPYSRVEVVNYSPTDNGYSFQVNFEKGPCEFVVLKAFGANLGVWSYLEWSSAAEGDRLAGGHTLDVNIETDGQSFDTIQMRTRHTCEGVKTDRILFTQEIGK